MDQSTLLIVDDSASELRVLVTALRSSGHRIVIANNGKEGYSRAVAFQPDLILMDVRMPVMSGFSACRLLKAEPRTASIPIIFLTSANTAEERLEGLRLGAVDYIAKPVLPEEVMLRVSIHLASRNKPDQFNCSATTTRWDPDESVATAACRILGSDLSTNITIDALARRVGTHRRRLSAVFRAKIGCTVYAWLRERRMLQARQWLADTPMSVQSIAQELGYTSPANFATAFKERFGCSPTEFRQNCRHEGHIDEGDISLGGLQHRLGSESTVPERV